MASKQEDLFGNICKRKNLINCKGVERFRVIQFFFNMYSEKRTILSNLSILIIHFNNFYKINYLVDA